MSRINSSGKTFARHSSQRGAKSDFDAAIAIEKARHIDLFSMYRYVGVCEYVSGAAVAHIKSDIRRSFMAPMVTRYPVDDVSNPDGKKVYYSVGLSISDPRRSRELRVVRWITDDNVAENCDQYIQSRQEWLTGISTPDLIEVLRSNWYLKTNPSRQREAFLMRDDLLAFEAIKRIDTCESLDTFCELWAACACSPALGREDERKDFFGTSRESVGGS